MDILRKKFKDIIAMHSLRKKFKDLIVKETDIRTELGRAEDHQKRPRQEVLSWLEDVETIKDNMKALERSLKDSNTRCFSSCTPRQKHSKVIEQISNEVSLLQRNSRFTDGLVFPEELEQFPEKTQLLAAPTLVGYSIQRILDEIWTSLKNPMVEIIGIHGIAGVGKTAAMMNINNRLAMGEIFDKVIWVTLSKKLSLKKVQNEIAVQLKVYLPTYENEASWAARLLESLKKVKKFLIIFDDMWEPIPLVSVGIPQLRRHNGSKVVFTTRSWNVGPPMKTDKYIFVDVLSEEEAWELFVSKAGDIVLTPAIQLVARQLVRECDYLPILIISLGHAMRGEVNAWVWMNALDKITLSEASTQGMEEKNLSILRFSYNRLKCNQVRNCFLYCAFFPEDYLFEPEELIKYWIAEGFIGEDGDMVMQIDEGVEILRELKEANMLETFTKRGHEWLKMHDLFRDLAIHIVRKEPGFLVKAGQGLTETPYFWEWADSRKISLMRNHITTLDDLDFYCPNISTLLLQDNPLSCVSPSFFNPMPAIKVLDMSNSGIAELPLSLSELANLSVLFLQNCTSLETIPSVENLKELQVLNLRGTAIKELPEGMRGLVRLRSLDLSNTSRLENIQAGVISSLIHIEELRLEGSLLCKMDSPMIANCLKEMRCLKRLAILTLSTVGFEHHLDTIMLLQEQNLKRFTINCYGSTGDLE